MSRITLGCALFLMCLVGHGLPPPPDMRVKGCECRHGPMKSARTVVAEKSPSKAQAKPPSRTPLIPRSLAMGALVATGLGQRIPLAALRPRPLGRSTLRHCARLVALWRGETIGSR